MEALSTPAVLFFGLGAAAAIARSDLAVPETIAKGMALYLMAAIGLKGGVEVAGSGLTPDMLGAVLAGVAMSFAFPYPAYFLLRRFGRLDATDGAAVAAHYGSVSVVTFAAGSEALSALGHAPAGYMVAVLALMETPAIVAGLLLAMRGRGHLAAGRRAVLRDALVNGPVVLLAGSFVVGLIVGEKGFASVAGFFEAPFKGLLCLFLLDMGLVAVRRLRESGALTWRLAVLAVAFPIAYGTIGVIVGSALGLGVGSAAALGILAGSASYIAVPAAMRLALPEANPGLSLAMSLGVSFSFNIVFGIPLFIWLATAVERLGGGPF